MGQRFPDLSTRANTALEQSPLFDASDLATAEAAKARIKYWGLFAMRRNKGVGEKTLLELMAWAETPS